MRESLSEGVQFTFDAIAPDTQKKIGTATLTSRNGLWGTVAFTGNLQPGSLLRETARSLPKTLTLRIGLDPALKENAIAAKDAIDALTRVEAIPFIDRETLYPKEVDYIFSVMTETYRAKFPANLPDLGSWGLFSQDFQEIIPDSFGNPDESLTEAISRLQGKFIALLAAKIVKQTLNGASSRLNVAASLIRRDIGDRLRRIQASAFTIRGQSPAAVSYRSRVFNTQLPQNIPFQFNITNYGDDPIYISVLTIDSGGEIVSILPQSRSPESNSQIAAGQNLLVPDPNRGEWEAQTADPGFVEALIIASQRPLHRAFLALQTLAEERKQRTGTPVLANEKAIGALLEDLSSDRSNTNTSSRYQFDATEIAALSISFEIIETRSIEVKSPATIGMSRSPPSQWVRR